MVGKSFEDFKTHAAGELAELQEYMADKVEGWAPTLEVDYDSFQGANNGSRIYGYLCSWYHPMSRSIKYAVRKFVEDYNGAEELKTIKTFRFEHHNNGFDSKDRWTLEDGVMTLKASFCCSSHAPDTWKVAEELALKLRVIAKGYKRDYLEKWVPKYEERTGELLGADKVIPVEVEWKTLEYKDWETNDESYAKMAEAYYGLGGRWGYNSIDRITDALRRSKESVEDITDAISKFVFRNIKGHNYRKRKTKYDHATKTMYIWSVFQESYWGTVSYYDLQEAIDMAVLINKLGGNSIYESLTDEQHKRATSALKSVAQSWSTRSGDIGGLVDLMESPLYTKYDNTTYKAFITMMKWINTDKFQKRFDDTPSDAEAAPAESEDSESADSDAEPNIESQYAEVFIHGWIASKLNFRGQFQDRLVFVTNKALYTVKYDFGSNKPEGGIGDKGYKHLHRHNFEWTRWMQVGPAKAKGGVSAPKVPGAAALDKVSGALGGDDAASGSAAVHHLFFLESDRVLKEEKKRGKKKMKMPEIPNLKEKIVGALESAKDAIAGIEMPSFELPKKPSFSLPSISKLIDKAVSKFGKPEMPSVDTPQLNTGGVGTYSKNACAADMPPAPEEMGMWESIKAKFAAMGIGSIGIPLPSIDIKSMFSGAVDKIKNSPLKIGLPSDLSISGILAGIAKALNPKTYGIPMPKIPSLDIGALFGYIKEAAGSAWDAVGDLCDKFVNGLKSIGASLVVAFKKLPKLPLKRILNMIMSAFSKIADKIPKPSLDLPGIKLPTINGPNMPKAPAMLAALKGPSEPEFMRAQIRPICNNKAASKWIALEMAWVCHGAAAAARKSWGPSVSETSSVDYETTMTSRAYNKMGKGKGNRNRKDIAWTEVEKFVEKDSQFYARIVGDVADEE